MSYKKGQPVNIPVICINDKDRPSDIPLSQWVKQNKPYTIIEFIIMNAQNGLVGVKLAEVNLDGCAPYIAYALNRFGILVTEDARLAEEAVSELLKESFKEKEELV